MATPRQGLNGLFSYNLPVSGTAVTYQVRVLSLAYGSNQIFSESMARTTRAFYPRNVVDSTFNVQIIIKGVNERSSFHSFITTYATNYLSPAMQYPPIMTFTCGGMLVRESGIPLEGFEFGNVVGSMLWTPTIQMQPTNESATPTGTQRSGGTGISNLDANSYQAAIAKSPEVKYFYPTGTILTGNEAPPSGEWAFQTIITSSAVDSIVGQPAPTANPDVQGVYTSAGEHVPGGTITK